MFNRWNWLKQSNKLASKKLKFYIFQKLGKKYCKQEALNYHSFPAFHF